MFRKTSIVFFILVSIVFFVSCGSLESIDYVQGSITDIEEVSLVGNPEGLTSYQGFTAIGGYGYSIKINSAQTSGILLRTDLSTGKTVTLKLKDSNGDTKKDSGSLFGHGNDMASIMVDGKVNLFVATMLKGTSSKAIVRLVINDDFTYSVLGNYGVTVGGSTITLSGIDIIGCDGHTITILGKNAKNFYLGTLNDVQTTGCITMKKVATFVSGSVPFEDGTINLSGAVNQGYHYYNGELFVPVSFDDYRVSYVMVFDLEIRDDGTVATLYPKEGRTLYFEDDAPGKFMPFEIETMSYDADSGLMYFNVNRYNYNGVARDGVLSIVYPL